MSLGILHICLPVPTLVSLWTAVSASALQSFVSQLWTSQTVVAECSDVEKHKLFGVYGGVILFSLSGLANQQIQDCVRAGWTGWSCSSPHGLGGLRDGFQQNVEEFGGPWKPPSCSKVLKDTLCSSASSTVW